MLFALHQLAGLFMHQGRFKRNLPPTLQLIAGSSQTDSACKSLEVTSMASAAPGASGYFSRTTSNCCEKCLTMSGEDRKWQPSGCRSGRRCSHRTMTHPPPRQHQYIHVIFGKDACLLFQDFQHCRCIFFLTLHHRKWNRLGLIASNVVLMWSRCLCSSAVFLTVFPLFPIYSSLIKSYPQAWGRHGFDRYAPPHSSLSFI